MSMNDNTPVDSGSADTTDDLDLFSADFFGQDSQPPEETANSEDLEQDEDTDVEIDAPINEDTQPDDTDEDNDEGEDSDEPDEGDEPEEPEDQPKPKKKNRFQERIDELTGKQREAERRAQELEARLNEALEKLNKPTDEEPKDTNQTPITVQGEPSPDDVNEDGTPKYPYGEFDPQYIKDLTKFAVEQERQEVLRREEEARQKNEINQARTQLQQEWNQKLAPAQERYPDFVEKGQNLLASLGDLEPAYGEYLSDRLMEMDYGPDVLYYLASNPDEARKIVDSGPAKATLALGRIEAKYALADEEKKQARPKVSKAPTPPAHTNKGSSASRIVVPPDTDDLDSFTDLFFK